MTCPHCTQGYVQDAGFAVCNRCGGTGHSRPARRGLAILRGLWALILLLLAAIYAVI
jgi:uncharacterized paraquat-inducible protein A